jgi:hypothetical protein
MDETPTTPQDDAMLDLIEPILTRCLKCQSKRLKHLGSFARESQGQGAVCDRYSCPDCGYKFTECTTVNGEVHLYTNAPPADQQEDAQ